MIAVLDTNVLVSALLSPFGTPARVLDLVLTGELTLAFDDRILAEYRDVLGRERFGFDPDRVDDVLDYFQATGQHVTAPPLGVSLPDPDDLPFLEVAAATGATLITGNARHYPAEVCQGVVVLEPAVFMEWWQKQPPLPGEVPPS